MTAILAIDFHYQIIVIADCRVSWDPPAYRPQDNLQKIYPHGPTGIIGFSGSVPVAKAIASYMRDHTLGKPLPPSAADIVSDIRRDAKAAYALLKGASAGKLELMYAAPDYANVSFAAPNATFASNLMIEMESPDFLPVAQADAIRLGYAVQYPMEYIRLNRNNLLNYGLTPEGRKFQVGIAIGTFAPALAKYAPTQVGGLFTVGVATATGHHWYPYGPIDGYELVIRDGRFVQIDHNTGRAAILQTVLEIDPNKPQPGGIVIDTPEI
jgi:hypothetical protein